MKFRKIKQNYGHLLGDYLILQVFGDIFGFSSEDFEFEDKVNERLALTIIDGFRNEELDQLISSTIANIRDYNEKA